MTVEIATYVNDLQPINPPSGDPVSQGDDHIRLIKQVLQNTLGNASRQFQVSTTRGVNASGTLLKSDGNGIVYVSTAAGAVVLTLPTLTAIDAGWGVNIVKTTSDVNPVFVAPPSGNISSAGVLVARARRAIPYRRFAAVWDGTNWFCERASGVPLGVMLDFWGSSLPPGYEWPNGQTLASVATNYPEYNAYYGTGATPDVRGLVCIPLDNLGGPAAGRLPHGFIAQTTLGATGGADGAQLSAGYIPNLSVSVSGSISGSGTFYPAGNSGYYLPISASGWSSYPNPPGPYAGPGYFPVSSSGLTYTNNVSGSVSGTCSATGTAAGSGGALGAMFTLLQPSVMCGKILVVE